MSDEVSFISKFGHEIKKGDRIVAVVQGWGHDVHTLVGEYIGVTPTGRVQLLTTDRRKPLRTRISTLTKNLVFPAPNAK